MADFGGLIGGIMKGFGGGLEQVGQVELKKQSEMDLRKQMLEMESEKRLREDEVRRERDLAYIPKTAEASARAEVTTAPIKAEANVAGRVATVTAENKAEINRLEAEADANKRLQKAEALKKSGALAAEANVSALTEKEKYKALIDNGVPKAKADALMADYNAAEPQRKKEAEDKIAAAINEAKKLAGDKSYLGAVSKIKVAESAGDIAEINAREAARNDSDKKERARNTIEMERQIKETNNEIGRIIGIGDPKKIPDELSYLQSQAKKGDKDAIEKLAKIKPLTDELDNLSRDLRSYKRSGSNTSGSSKETAYKVGETRTVESGANKGKTVEWDGNGWVLKK